MDRTFGTGKLIAYCFVLIFSAACSNSSKKENTTSKEEIAKDPELAKLNAMLKTNPDDAETLHKRAKYFVAIKDVGRAGIDISRVLEIDTTKAAYFLTAADIHLLMNNSGKSKSALDKCLQLEPKNIDALLKMAELYLFAGQNKASLEYTGKVMELDRNNTKNFFMIGMNQKELGDTGKAIYAFQRVIELDSKNYNAYLQLGILFGSKKNPLCLDYYSTARKLKPNGYETYYNEGVFLQQSGNFNQAIKSYNKSIELMPQFVNNYYNLGVIYLNDVKDFELALKMFEKAEQINPNMEEIFYMQGLTQEKRGNLSEAKAAYNKALHIKPDYEGAFEAMKRLDRIR